MRAEIDRRLEPIAKWLMSDVNGRHPATFSGYGIAAGSGSSGVTRSSDPPRIEILTQWASYPFRLLFFFAKKLLIAWICVTNSMAIIGFLFFPRELEKAFDQLRGPDVVVLLNLALTASIIVVGISMLFGGYIGTAIPPRLWPKRGRLG